MEIGVERLKDLQPILAPRVKDSKLKVVGALYDVRNWVVTMVGFGDSAYSSPGKQR